LIVTEILKIPGGQHRYRVGIGNIADFYVLTANAVGCNAATPGEDGTSIVGRNGYERRLYDADIRAAECGVELGVKKVAPGVVVFENDVGIPSDNGGSDVTRGIGEIGSGGSVSGVAVASLLLYLR